MPGPKIPIQRLRNARREISKVINARMDKSQADAVRKAEGQTTVHWQRLLALLHHRVGKFLVDYVRAWGLLNGFDAWFNGCTGGTGRA